MTECQWPWKHQHATKEEAQRHIGALWAAGRGSPDLNVYQCGSHWHVGNSTVKLRARIRRVGVRIEKLVPADEAYRQPTLDAPERGMREVEIAADAAVLRFGPDAVRRASLTGGGARSAPPGLVADQSATWATRRPLTSCRINRPNPTGISSKSTTV